MSDRAARVREAVESGRRAAVIEALAGAPETERRPIAAELMTAARAYQRASSQIVQKGPNTWGFSGTSREESLAANVALLGTASLTELRKLGWQYVPRPSDVVAVMVDRRPTWLAEWCDDLLRRDMGRQSGQYWTAVRELAQAGIIQRPRGTAYLAGMIRTAGSTPDRSGLAMLRREPDLLEHELWDLFVFEDESSALNEYARFSPASGWPEAILTLTSEGVIDRRRLLDAILSALARDWPAHHCTWFVRLWSGLEATPDERAERSAGFALLLGTSAKPVLGFAADELFALARAGTLDPAVVPQLAPALAAPAKKTANRGIAILDQLVRRAPESAAAAALVVTGALGSTDAEVQAKALDRLTRWMPSPDEAVAAELRRARPGVATAQRAAVDALLAAAHGAVAETSETPIAASQSQGPAPAWDELRRRVGVLPAPIVAALDLERMLDDPSATLPTAPVAGEPVLDPALAVAPIASIDELGDALLGVVVGDNGWEGSQLELELIGDAVLRFCGDRLAFDGPLRPLVKRIEAHADRVWQLHPLTVAAAWMNGEPPALHRSTKRPTGSNAERVWQWIEDAAAGRTRPTIALPTHRSGWIDPRVLVERIASAELEDADDSVELACAFLRLAPDGREAALAAATGLPGDAARLLRTALGDGSHAEPTGRAARAANAVRPDATLPSATFDDEGSEQWHRCAGEVVGLEGFPADDPAAELRAWITATASAATSYHGAARVSIAWPAALTLGHTFAAMTIRHDLRAGSKDSRPELVTLRLLHSDRAAIEPTAAQHLVWSISAETKERCLLGVDVCIAAIAEGRLDASLLAAPIRQGLRHGILIPGRLADRLSDVAAVSDLHRAVVRDAVDLALAIDTAPRNLVHLLTALDEWCAQTDTAVAHGATRTFLGTLTGTSKAARTARSLLARTAARPSHEHALRADALLWRAERWMQLAGAGIAGSDALPPSIRPMPRRSPSVR